MPEPIGDPGQETINLVAWNILLNRKRPDLVAPQHERRDSHVETLRSLGGRSLDVVMLCEVENTNAHGHNGKYIANQLGFDDGYWHRHSRKGEYIGMFGMQVSGADMIELPHNKVAVVTETNGITAVGVHLKYQTHGPEREEQVRVLLDELGDIDQVAIKGDFNGIPFEKFRRLLRDRGYSSAFHKVGQRRPMTLPTSSYRKLSGLPRPLAVSIDDVIVKGLEVTDAFCFEGDSDHRGVGASVVVPRQAA